MNLTYFIQPLCVEIDDKVLTLHGLKQYVLHLEEVIFIFNMIILQKEKNRRLTEVLDNTDFNQVVIFVDSPARAKALQKLMTDWSFPCISLTANMPVEERMRHYLKFKEAKVRILITTHMFGRGVDVEKVNMVVNYDFPKNSSDYLHRVGRAGRFGTNGITVSFVSGENDEKMFAEVESRFETKMFVITGEITKETFNTM